jgi:ankyrin repeat protein
VFDDITLYSFFAPGGVESYITSSNYMPYFSSSYSDPYDLPESLESKVLYYKQFASGPPKNYFGQTITELVKKIEPLPTAQQPFLRLVLDLLVWSQTLRGLEIYFQDTSYLMDQMDHEHWALEFSLVILKGDLAEVKQNLSSIADLSAHSQLFGPFLLAAVVGNHYDIAEILIQAGARPFNGGHDFHSSSRVLAAACSYESMDFAKLILENRRSSSSSERYSYLKCFERRNYTPTSEWYPLSFCVRWGKLEMTQLLLDHIFPAEPSVSTLLYLAQPANDWDSIMMGSPLNCALGWALTYGKVDIAHELLEFGAEKYIRNHSYKLRSHSRQPIYQIFYRGEKEMLNRFLQLNMGPSIIKDPEALIGAASGGQLEFAQWLLDHQFNFLRHGRSHPTRAVANACLHGHLSMVIFLKKQGLPPYPGDYSIVPEDERESVAWSCINAAICCDHSEVLEWLLQNGASADGGDNAELETYPLIIASSYGSLNCVKVLLDYGANLDYVDVHTHERPVEIAYDNGHITIAKLLLKRGADTNRCEILSLL